MPTISNNTDQPIEASTGHVVPANGTLTVTDKTWARVGSEPYIAGKMSRSHLTVSTDPAPKPKGAAQEITRSTIAKANRADLLGIIGRHSDYTEADLEGLTVEDRQDGTQGLRSLAAGLVFGG